MPSCLPNDLTEAAKGYQGISPAMLEAVKVYLLAQIAGLGSSTPDELAALAKCYACISPTMIKGMEVALLCTATGGVPVCPPVGNCSSQSGDIEPLGAVTPEFVGQLYVENPGPSAHYWYSTGTTSADWTEIASGASRGGDTFGLFSYGDSGATGAQIITDTVNVPGYHIEGEPNITSLDFPNLTYIDPSDVQVLDQVIENCASLTAIRFPVLKRCAGRMKLGGSSGAGVANPLLSVLELPLLESCSLDFWCQYSSLTNFIADAMLHVYGGGASGGLYLAFNSLLQTVSLQSLQDVVTAVGLNFNPVLQSVDLRSLVTVGSGGASWQIVYLDNCPNLTSVRLDSFVPSNGRDFSAANTALNATSVNQILARHVANAGYVSGTINLSGGTASAPTGQGIADAATLTGRGVTVITN